MPGNNLSPPIALLSEFDAREWAGVTVYTRGSAVALSSTAGVFEDVLAFLHGYGMQAGRDMAADAAAKWTASGAAGTITCALDASDRVYFESDTVDFKISAGAGNTTYGFDSAGHALVGGGAPFRRTATAEWVRGNVTNITIEIDPDGAPAAFAVPAVALRSQSVVTMLRASALADADGGVTSSLMQLDNTANDNVNRRISAGLTDAGLVYFTRPTGVSAALTWDSTTLRDRLGFTGSEAESASGGLTTLTATYPCPGVFVPGRPARRVRPWHWEKTETVDLTSGDIAANHIARRTGWDCEVWAGGPVDVTDFERHLRDRMWRYAPVGFPCALHQHYGDPRRAIATWQITASQSAYTVLSTSERNGRRGRLRCLRDAEDVVRRSADYEGTLDMRQLISISLRDRVD